MSAPMKLARGGEGEAVRFEGEVLEAALSRAIAPGTPVDFVVLVEETELAVRGKAIRSRIREDGRYDVRFRMLNLGREARDRLRAIPPG